MGSKFTKLFFEFKGLIFLIVLSLIVRSSVVNWITVPAHSVTSSMTPTIIAGDRVLFNKLAYDLRFPFFKWSLLKLSNPKRGEIVLINSQKAGKPLIKRIIAIPGDEIYLKDNRVIINNDVLNAELLNKGYDDIAGFEEKLESNWKGSEMMKSYTIRLYVNQEDASPLKNMAPTKIPEGYYFVMGDNRHVSDDSRLNLKLVPREEITGRASDIIFSADYENYRLPRSDRWFISLD